MIFNVVQKAFFFLKVQKAKFKPEKKENCRKMIKALREWRIMVILEMIIILVQLQETNFLKHYPFNLLLV